MGDIGTHFPPHEARWKDADSMELLRRTVELVEEAGLQSGNVDVTVICERPRLSPHKDAMRESLASGLGLSVDRVSVKGKTNEGMGWTGSGEGLAVHAVALLEARPRHSGPPPAHGPPEEGGRG